MPYTHKAIPHSELLLSVVVTPVGTHLALYVTAQVEGQIRLSNKQEICSGRGEEEKSPVELAEYQAITFANHHGLSLIPSLLWFETYASK